MWEREGFIQSQGLRLRYLEKGQGKAVVLLHGFGDCARVWEFVLPYLGDRGRFIALDQRGHGLSDRADLQSYSTFDFVQDLHALLETLGLDEVCLVGHSMGGRNAIVYAALHPQRVKKLVVIDYGPELSAKGRRRIVRALRERGDVFRLEDMAKALIEENPRLTLQKAFLYLEKVTCPLGDGLHSWLCDNRLFEQMRKGKRVLRDIDLKEFLSRVKVPILLIRGKESDLLDEEGVDAFLKSAPNTELREIHGAGHAVPVDNPEELARVLLEFIG